MTDALPRVVVILLDSLRRDAVGAYGGFAHTPNMDRLAQEGTLFEQAYTGSFPTMLLRNELYTGRPTFLYKAWAPLGAEERTLAEDLSDAGFLTGLVTDNYHPYTLGYGYQRGFASWDLVRGQESDPYRIGPQPLPYPCDPDKLREPERAVQQYLRNVQDRKDESDYFCAQTFRRAARWLEDVGDRPFFLMIDSLDPHEPWDPPPYYVDRYDPGYVGQQVIYPRYDHCDYLSDTELYHCRALYAAEVTMVDAWLGYFLQRLESIGLSEGTLVVVLSDHGFYFGEHGFIGKSLIREGMQEPLPLYPEVCRIPLMVRGPGVPTGRLQALCQPADLHATLRAIFNLPTNAHTLGRNLQPLWSGSEDRLHPFVVASPSLITPSAPQPHPSARATITDGHRLLILGARSYAGRSGHTLMVDNVRRSLGFDDQPRPIELYDLQHDPGCAHNLYTTASEDAQRLQKAFYELLLDQQVAKDVASRFALD